MSKIFLYLPLLQIKVTRKYKLINRFLSSKCLMPFFFNKFIPYYAMKSKQLPKLYWKNVIFRTLLSCVINSSFVLAKCHTRTLGPMRQ